MPYGPASSAAGDRVSGRSPTGLRQGSLRHRRHKYGGLLGGSGCAGHCRLGDPGSAIHRIAESDGDVDQGQLGECLEVAELIAGGSDLFGEQKRPLDLTIGQRAGAIARR